jgi:hypothetical protein
MSAKTRLKWLLCIEAAFIIGSIVSGVVGEAHLPQQLQNYQATIGDLPHTLVEWVGLAVYLLLLPTALTATIGLFFSWRPARPLYLWTRIIVVILSAVQGPSVAPALAEMFDEAAVLVAGVVIGMLYFSQVRELYDKPVQPPNTALEPTAAAPSVLDVPSNPKVSSSSTSASGGGGSALDR